MTGSRRPAEAVSMCGLQVARLGTPMIQIDPRPVGPVSWFVVQALDDGLVRDYYVLDSPPAVLRSRIRVPVPDRELARAEDWKPRDIDHEVQE